MDKTTIWQLVTNQFPTKKHHKLMKDVLQSPQLLAQYQELKKLWSLSAAENTLSEPEVNIKYQQFKKNYQSINVKNNWLGSFSKYAAMVVIMLSVAYGLWVNHTEKPTSMTVTYFESGTGSNNSIKLADGSQIWLNSNSSINIQEQSNKHIEIQLVGEALFDIIHNEKRQFTVNTEDLKIRDLGTRFTVKSYPNDAQITATLVEGEIEVSNHKIHETLSPGEKITYTKTNGKYVIAAVDTTYVGSWKKDKFEFIDKTLKDIAKDLENYYGVNIQFENTQLGNERFTGVIQKRTSIEKVMDIISYSAGIQYSMKETKNSIEIMIK
ncbi:FecR family protein [Carboxylicivirga sp. M1479]|uniref:FecR family protein n=1 Tax=Carboxylicivirga sp. M1479 TaxID=2594476 RepID=UPI00117793A5|nr:FecR family protein [Carboxylicivirga sp. M1479]TRX71479.1 FecR family protein [Carboxylicivirga sp. M1479]